MDHGFISKVGQLEEEWGGNRNPVTTRHFGESPKVQTLHASLVCCLLSRLHLTINNFRER